MERTLGILWFFQNTLGVNWAPDDAEACATPYNLAKMRERGIRDDLLPLAAMLPQIPYVREARRLAGVQTLVGRDFYVRAKDGKAARHWASSVAINDYSFDLHGTEDALEPDLDEPDPVNGTGPVCVPFGVFIPEKVDGLVPAEKNISQSRLVNGATRLQPSTLLNGQAAGAIAALSALQKTPPRRLNIIAVQTALLASGDTLVPRWFGDVPHGSPLWRATQLLALYGIMDVETANVLKTEPLGETTRWGADRKPDAAENAATLARLAAIIPDKSLLPSAGGLARFPDRAALALHLATLVARHGRYHLGDPEPWQSAAHQRDLAAALAKRDASRSKGK
ncbi:MAG: FAD-dependent oxidoreductase [Opitutaceae bacterium]|nr:FAD-dependent oxidoreductase [Opitutaceae bacterium]